MMCTFYIKHIKISFNYFRPHECHLEELSGLLPFNDFLLCGLALVSSILEEQLDSDDFKQP